MDTSFPRNNTTAKIDGGKIRRLRESKGLTQLYVATVVGVTTDTISRWENRRYPSIKPENAKKLAEALEVRLDEILEDRNSEVQSALQKVDEGKRNTRIENLPRKKIKVRQLLLPFFVIISLMPTMWWFYAKQQSGSVRAYRILPAHVPAGQIFPVVIHVEAKDADSFSLILKESLPEGCVLVRSAPPFTSFDEKKGILKWIRREGGKKATFAYTAKTADKSGEGMQYRFSGTVTLRNVGSSTTDISGSNSITSLNFHWADANRDGRIDDEEILTVYDTFSALDELGFDWELIDDIWSGQGYLWDPVNQKYVIKP